MTAERINASDSRVEVSDEPRRVSPAGGVAGQEPEAGSRSSAAREADNTGERELLRVESPADRRIAHVVNFPLLVATIVVLAVLVPAGHYWHKYQLGRISQMLLDRAAVLAEEGNWSRAAAYTNNYLRLRPDDAPARVRLARQHDQAIKGAAGHQRAVDLYYQALGVATEDEQPELRTRLAELLLEQRRFTEARQEALKLLERNPEDATAHRLQALAAIGLVQQGASASVSAVGGAVGEIVEVALQKNPTDAVLAVAFAGILRERPELLGDAQREQLPQAADRANKADATMNRLVAANPEDPLIYLARDDYRLQYGLSGCEEDRLEALRLGGDRAEVRQAAAVGYERQARAASERQAEAAEVERLQDAAIEQYQNATKLAPDIPGNWQNLSGLLIARGRAPQAIATLSDGIAQVKTGELPLRALLVEQLTTADKLDEAEQALAGLEESLQKALPRMVLQARGQQERTRDLLKATLELKRDHPRLTLELAVPVSTDSLASPREKFQAWCLLGDAYAKVDAWDRSAAALEEAARLLPGQRHLLRAAGLAWLKAGQPSSAAKVLQQAGSSTPGTSGVELGRARLAEQLMLPASKRNWSRLESLLRELAASDYRDVLPKPWQVDFLQIDYALARIREDAAPRAVLDRVQKMLANAEQQYAQHADFWLEAALRYENLRQPADTDRALAEARRLGGDSPVEPLMSASIHARRQEYDRAAQILEEALARLPDSEHASLRSSLIQVLTLQGRQQAARQKLLDWHKAAPEDPLLLQQLVMLELNARQWEAASGWEARLQVVEGSSGANWRFLRARRLLTETSKVTPASVQEATGLCAELLKLRPQWANTYLLQGWLSELRGDHEAALEAYQEAFKLGESRTVICERIVRILYRLKRLAEANEYLSRLDPLLPGSADLSSLAISIAAGLNDLERAEAVAKQGVTSRPQDPISWVSYGLTLLANQHSEEAEQALQKALELAPKDIEVWGGVFQLFAVSGQTEKARKVLEQLPEQVDAPAGQLAFVMAQGYAMLGELEQAEEQFRAAMKLEPEGIPVRARWVGFLLQHKPAEAEAALRELIEVAQRNPQNRHIADDSRRVLAALLARRGNDQDLEEAMRLVEQSGGDQQIGSLDKRLQALFLSQRPNPDLDGAERLLVDLLYGSRTGVDADHLLLASIYVRQSELLTGKQQEQKLAAARKEYEAVCLRTDATPNHLLPYVDFLLDQEFWQEAAPSLRRLETAAPDDPRVLLLRVRWLIGREQTADIQPLVEAFVARREQPSTDDPARLQLYLNVGRIYTAIQQHAAAEEWYRRAMTLDASAYVYVASTLHAQGRTAEAVQLCADKARQDKSPEAAAALANLLVLARSSDADAQPLEPILLKALADHPSDGRLAFAVATLRAVQGRNAEAVQFYRQVVRLRPSDTVAMNNLATLLAEDEQQLGEALKVIDEAIRISGQHPPLLDTKAMILVQLQRPDDALPLLRDAAAAAPRSDPRYHFHLAVALHRTGYREQASAAFHTALEGGLHNEILTATDRSLLEELTKSYPAGKS